MAKQTQSQDVFVEVELSSNYRRPTKNGLPIDGSRTCYSHKKNDGSGAQWDFRPDIPVRMTREEMERDCFISIPPRYKTEKTERILDPNLKFRVVSQAENENY